MLSPIAEKAIKAQHPAINNFVIVGRKFTVFSSFSNGLGDAKSCFTLTDKLKFTVMRSDRQGVIHKHPLKARFNRSFRLGSCKFCLCYLTQEDNNDYICTECYKELGSGA